VGKNKGTFGKAKSEVEEQDEFVSGMAKLGQTLKPHQGKIIILSVLVIGGLAAYATMDYMNRKKAESATTAFNEALTTAAKPVAAPAENKDGGVDVAPPSPDSFDSLQARADATLATLAGVGGKAATAAELLRASQFMKTGRYDDAVNAYAIFAKSGEPPSLRIIAREGLGYALEGKAEAIEDEAGRKAVLEQALQAFTDMQPKEGGPRHEYAVYHQARMLAALGRTEEARTKLQGLLDSLDPTSMLKDSIEGRLSSLDATK
jgi:hypothetical protein